ncbi:hypothetical protein [Tropicimonas marinistellae]|uniref:hypothetical protein n=1 Tax=Tropicimonas marinistellae TaxID=1739787 RepID=UPI0008368509|nr:hypothetical protein [Tropicimonas marinistellae]
MTLPILLPEPAHLVRSRIDPDLAPHPALDSVDWRAGPAVRAEIEARLLETDALPLTRPAGLRARMWAWLPEFRLWLRSMPLP